METALQKLAKILDLEQRGGYRNVAVIGGVQRYIPNWIEEAREQAGSETAKALVEQIGDLLIDYGQLDGPSARAKLIEPIQRRLAQAIESTQSEAPAPPPPPPMPSALEELEPAAIEPDSTQSAEPEPPDEKLAPLKSEPAEPPADSLADQDLPAEIPAELSASVETLLGVGPSIAGRLEKLGIETVEDLLRHYPRRYIDYSATKSINQLQYGEQVTILGRVWETSLSQTKTKRPVVRAVIGDGTGKIQCVWFGQPYLIKQLTLGSNISLSGQVSSHLGRLILTNPDWEPEDIEYINTNRIVPIYPLIERLGTKQLRKITKATALQWRNRMPDHLPREIRNRQSLMKLGAAIDQIHFPATMASLADARRRLAFDELFLLQLGMLRMRQKWQSEAGIPLPTSEEWLAEFLAQLPFQLTSAQRRALGEVLQDLGRDVPMNRLLQGDVGSGKTVVAAAAMAAAVNAGAQAALMAPTEILAEQHAAKIRELIPQAQVRLLTGSLSASDKEALYAEMAGGRVDIVVGTHALIQAGVAFKQLGLAIVDEQHRFGVEQRGALRQKGYNPHMLVMTATPIPRTLALTAYGDLDISLIDELPPGRQAVATYVVKRHQRERAYNLIRKQVNAGRQAFIICPLVEASENNEARAAVEEHERLQDDIFAEFKLGLLHGRMSSDEKEMAMQDFYAKRTQILVSTSVVEVGIDVPNATVMLVEGANRFGLAQLHQFRGRVGRGAFESYCLLLADSTSEEADERLAALQSTNDGFVLAEKDLELRGPGEFFGTRQSGLPEFRMAQLSEMPLLQKARQEAQTLFEQDQPLTATSHRLLAARLDEFWSGRGDIS